MRKFLLFLTALLSFNLTTLHSYAQTNNAQSASTGVPTRDFAQFDSPREAMEHFLSAMVEYKQNPQTSILDRATEAFNLSHIDPAARRSIARRAAEHLINTLDRLERINLDEIPTEMDAPIWYFRRQNINLNDQRVYVEIAIAETPAAGDYDQVTWLFTPETIETIPHYFRFVRERPVVEGVQELQTLREKILSKLPSSLRKEHFVLYTWQWIGIFLILLIGLIADQFFKFYLNLITRRFLRKQNILFDEKLQKKLAWPITFIFIAIFWNLGVVALDFSQTALSFSLRMGRVLFTIGLITALYHIVDIVSYYFQELARRSSNRFDDILVPLVRKAAKTVIVAVGIVAVGDSLTFDMKGILAGLGIGGIAFALAARDTISNMFGSITVLLDRPFHIGDWVNIGGNVEGVVEEVGLRSTRIRTFYNSQITVPNGQLTNVHIDNYGRRSYRRFLTTLGLQYDTPPEKIEAFCEAIRQIILNKESTRKDLFHIYFNDFNNSSLDIMVYIFFKVPDWQTELAERHQFLLDVLRVGAEIGVRFAFPTQTLHVYNEENQAYKAFDLSTQDLDSVAKENARKILERPINTFKNGHRSSSDAF